MSKRIVVAHDWYGCETGCCGTSFMREEGEVDDAYEIGRAWEFEHYTEEEARAEAEKKRKGWGAEWAYAKIVIGELRCFDEQVNP